VRAADFRSKRFAQSRGNHFMAGEPAGMDDANSKSSQDVNPYRFERDDALETFARGVIDEAIAKSTASPRQFGYYSMMAARQIAQYVLSNFSRRKADG
jgi:hypothetical protein